MGVKGAKVPLSKVGMDSPLTETFYVTKRDVCTSKPREGGTFPMERRGDAGG